MTVKKRLILNVVLTAAGIAVILLVSIFAIFRIKSSVYMLTAKSTPLQVKTIELQQLVEKVSADLMRLGLSEDERDMAEVSGQIEKTLKDIERINGEIQAISNKGHEEVGNTFKGIYQSVAETVDMRIKNLSLFGTEAERVNLSFVRVENALSDIGGDIGALTYSAKDVARISRKADRALNVTIKKLQALQLKLKDVKIALAEIDTVQNKYKLSPIKERIKATDGSVQAVVFSEGDPEIIKEAKEALRAACQQMLKDGSGLIALKALSFGDAEAEGQYKAGKENLTASLESINSKMTEFVDGFEIDILKQRENMESTQSLQETADTVGSVGNLIGLKVKELNSMVKRVMLSRSDDELKEVVESMKRTEAAIVEGIKKLEKIFASSGGSEGEEVLEGAELTGKAKGSLADAMKKNTSQMLQAMEVVSASIGRITAAKKEVIASDMAMEKAIATIKETSAKQSSEGREQVESIAEKQKEVVANVNGTVRASMLILVSVSFVVLLALIIASGKTTMSIVNPLEATQEVMASVEGGDLTKKIQVQSEDEIGKMCRSFNSLVEKLHSTVLLISDRSNVINEQAAAISSSVEQQASFTAELSSSVAEISSTMEELSASSSQIAEHSRSVVEAAEKSLRDAKDGAGAVGAVTGKLGEISGDNQRNIAEIVELGKKSKEISKIMEIINTIADQTKLIAFNAALEASSAGEAGKRFGVVAAEIRRLADSVMESTGEIEGKVGEIQEAINRLVIASEKGAKGMDEGVRFSTNTVSMLDGIVDAVKSTTEAAKQISLSTQQQKTANNQVLTALKDMVTGTEQTSKAIVGINAASKGMANLSEDLKGLVGQFRLNEKNNSFKGESEKA